MKDLKQRMDECGQIRTDLLAAGIMNVPKYKCAVVGHLNDYIRNGTSQTHEFNIPDATGKAVGYVLELNSDDGAVSGLRKQA